MIGAALFCSIIFAYFVGRMIGREETKNAYLDFFSEMRGNLSWEEKLQFDSWLEDQNLRMKGEKPGAKTAK